MGNTINVQSTMSLQNITSGAHAYAAQYDRCNHEKERIEKNESLAEQAKDPRLQQLEQSMDELEGQIADIQEKEDSKNLEEQLKKKKEQLQNMYDSTTAQSMLKMEEFMQLAAASEESLQDPEAVKEITDILSDVNAELSSDSDSSQNTDALKYSYENTIVYREDKDEDLGQNLDEYL